MAYFVMKPEDRLAWIETKERLELQGRQILRRMMNMALDAAEREFVYNLQQGGLKAVERQPEELKKLLFQAARKELGYEPGNKPLKLIEPTTEDS